MQRAWPVLLALPALAAGAGGWPELSALLDGADEASYLGVLRPALEAIKLSYTATHGSYRRIGDVNASLPGGWQRFPELDADPPGGGFHGLVFFHAATRRSILALRGTDLGTRSASGLADRCADRLLWDNAKWESLPPECWHFPPTTLDYLSSAGAFADRALAALPVASAPLLVGHSLGAGLAVLLAAKRSREQRWRPWAFGLSAPPWSEVLRRRVGREPSELDRRRLALVYNAFDPIYRRGTSAEGKGAAICTYAPPEPAACAQCYLPRADEEEAKSPECNECFAETHVLKNYLVHLNGTLQRPPPFRPRCLGTRSSHEALMI